MSEQGKQINLQNLYETVRAERDQYQQKCRDLEQEVKRVRIAYNQAARRAMARRRLLTYWQKDWKKKYEELKRLRTKLAAVREVYELAREHAPKGQWHGHGFGVIADRLGQILGFGNVEPDMEGEEECPTPGLTKSPGSRSWA